MSTGIEYSKAMPRGKKKIIFDLATRGDVYKTYLFAPSLTQQTHTTHIYIYAYIEPTYVIAPQSTSSLYHLGQNTFHFKAGYALENVESPPRTCSVCERINSCVIHIYVYVYIYAYIYTYMYAYI